MNPSTFLRIFIFIIVLISPGILSPHLASHVFFAAMPFVYVRMLLDPALLVLVFSVFVLMTGDSFAGLFLGSTGLVTLLAGFSAFVFRRYWLSRTLGERWAGYALHVGCVVVLSRFVWPDWSWSHVTGAFLFSLALFPLAEYGTRLYLACLSQQQVHT
jgi:hypothetical protein